jgi:Fic-DOC domain mobile mystery protein B
MSPARDDPAPSQFNIATIGPEPSGATPIEPEDLEGLIPDFVATRADLNLVEFENIAKVIPWTLQEAQRRGLGGVLDYWFLMSLHRRMFEDVWKWAGTQRQRVTNIGVEPSQIITQARLLFDDAAYWHEHGVYDTDELAARIHARLVSVHPFPNGNGRCTRMMADLYRVSIGTEPFLWGRGLDVDRATRETYIAALLTALNTDDYTELIRFARGQA